MQDSDFNLEYQNKHVDSRIIGALERISQGFKTLLWQESKMNALSPIQIQILIFILFHPEDKCRISALASEFNLTKATISDAIKILEQKKLIVKIPELHDTRSYTIILTPSGKEAAEKSSYFSKALLSPLENLNTEEKGKLLLQLIHIINHLQQIGIITVQRTCFSCKHYRSIEMSKTHFCALLRSPLKPEELRIDCPDFIPVEV